MYILAYVRCVRAAEHLFFFFIHIKRGEREGEEQRGRYVEKF